MTKSSLCYFAAAAAALWGTFYVLHVSGGPGLVPLPWWHLPFSITGVLVSCAFAVAALHHLKE